MSVASMKEMAGRQSDLFLVLGVVGILMVLFVPIPPALLDFLLIANLSFALMILLMTFYVEKPLQFSTFPSLLLIATLFRLSLNIASTRLILSDGSAGKVIGTIGEYMVGGNYVIGLIVFLVLIVVQYVVVTNGAQRVAEVAARFTLDGMPGKQMSIDADLNMGLINEQQAQDRRKLIEKEANFYGAMDGASKFVKGDAIAGIIIILINIIGGLTVGIAQHEMEWAEALSTYTLLTVGDGIVTQIPALVISTGTGIIVTRAASDAFLGKEIGRQLTAFPKILGLVCAALLFSIFLPGIPVIPVILLLAIFLLLFVVALKKKPASEEKTESEKTASEEIEDLYGLMSVEALELKVGSQLLPIFGSGETSVVLERVATLRKQHALDMGLVMPRLRVKDDKQLASNCYEILIRGVKAGAAEVYPNHLLAIDRGNASRKLDGIETVDPTFNIPAVWIEEDQREAARSSGYTVIEPLNVLMTHLAEIVRQQSAALLGRGETEVMVDRVRQQNASLVEELVPAVLSLGDVQKVLQRLLREKVSIRNIESILEVLVDEGRQTKDPELLAELVRQRLGGTICQALTKTNELKVLVFDPKVEQKLAAGLRQETDRAQLLIEPSFAEQILTRLAAHAEKMMSASIAPVLLCSPELRRHIRRITERSIPHLTILSMSEVPTSVSVQSFGRVAV